MLEQKRNKFNKLSQKIGWFFSKPGLSPNQYTLLSLLFAVVSFSFLIKFNLVPGFIFFLGAAFLDLVDGAVARHNQQETKRGAYLDTVCDRYVEGIVLLGFLFLPLLPFILPAKIWIFLALFGGFSTTYVKAAAKEKDLLSQELKAGLVGRGERIILISLSFILGIFNISWLIYPIIILAIFSNLTAVQRIFLALNPSQN